MVAHAPAFLYHQVRLMVATLVAVGKGELEPEDATRLLEGKGLDGGAGDGPGARSVPHEGTLRRNEEVVAERAEGGGRRRCVFARASVEVAVPSRVHYEASYLQTRRLFGAPLVARSTRGRHNIHARLCSAVSSGHIAANAGSDDSNTLRLIAAVAYSPGRTPLVSSASSARAAASAALSISTILSRVTTTATSLSPP